VDDEETNRKFAEQLGVDFPILSDPGKDVAKAYGVLIPGIGVANRWTFYIGADGKILDVDRSVSPKTAGADLAARLEKLGVSRRRAE
jgi:thioredoxin-dependent peroxiredoxin